MNTQSGKKELEAVQRTNRFFETLLRASADGIVITDASQNIIVVNEAFCAFFEAPRQSVVETNLFIWLEQLDGDATQQWSDVEKQVLTEGTSRDVEFTLTTKHKERWLSVNASLLEQVSHEETGVITSIWRDVTSRKRSEATLATYRDHLEERVYERTAELQQEIMDRKKAEKALKESEEQFRGIYEHMTVGVARVSLELRIKSANEAYCRMLGYREKELIGKHLRDITHPNTVEDNLRKQSQLAAGEIDHYRMEKQFIHKKGDVIHGILDANLVCDAKGKPSYFLGSVLDITQRKQAEKALRKSEAKYRTMMESMKDAVYICSPDYRMDYLNPAMINTIGHDATGEHCFKAIHGLEKKCPWCEYDRVRQGQSVESDIISPKNNRSYLVSHFPIVHEDGSVSKMTVYRDTTDMKKMETQLQQAQKMEAIGTLAGGIAHDFNNILFPIFGYLEMILEDVPKDDPIRGNLAEVFSGAKRARDLVQQILTFSRQSDHKPKPLKTQLVIKEALKLIKSSLPSTIEIRQNIEKDCGLVMADPTHIHQIVMNLCTNAFHAMEENGGKLSVTLKEVALAAKDLKDPAMLPGPHTCLTVTDTGPGMDQGTIARIFDPYFTTKAEGKGTGLGLAVVHGIVKSHGGHIGVDSQPGKGTAFKVYLPVIKLRETARSIEADLPVQKGTERILLVDDQVVIVQMIRQMLERMGYHVTARLSSTDALEVFRIQPDKFDLVITDLTMPNMTGDRLAMEMMGIRYDIPVILCTGFSEKMSREKAKSLGIKGFLMKPIVKTELAKTIREVLDDQSDDSRGSEPGTLSKLNFNA